LKNQGQTETHDMSALDRPAAELTVMDVYDIAAVLGQEFERVIDKFGCECLVGVVPRVVRVLEFLEALVGRRERSDRYEQEKKHQKVSAENPHRLDRLFALQKVHTLSRHNLKLQWTSLEFEELEQVEDVWRGEVQDLLSQITQLQAENKRLLNTAQFSVAVRSQTSEKESQVIQKLKDLADKQRDEIRAKDHELTLRNEDVEALQLQQHRLIRINQDLLHRTGLMEAQGKTLIQQRAELEASAQAQQQDNNQAQSEMSKILGRRGEVLTMSSLSQQQTVGANQLVVDLNDPNRPRFTMQELKEVLQERNQLKAQLMVAQEELQLYKR
uniref:Rab interacting lysosomal protein-like 2 n=1 Tax=Poecilia formosa TaxID=48698 RepID=A0A096LRN9_POEFO